MLPTKICSRCIFSLDASIEFHAICEKADKTLKDLLVEQHTDIVSLRRLNLKHNYMTKKFQLTEMPQESSFNASEDAQDSSREEEDDSRIMEKDNVQ